MVLKRSEIRLEKIHIALLILAVAAVIILFWWGYRILPEQTHSLPYYAFLSVSRITAAYFVSLIFAISMGFTAASRSWARKILLPTLDILQSVPVVGFFPVAIFFFISLFSGQRIGIELASIFLIFTSQAWNMAFGVYQSLITIPVDLLRLKDAYGLRGAIAFRKFYLPATVPSLVFNSMVSWANSWFFLMTSEIFAIGVTRYELPGLGYYLFKSSQEGNLILTILGLFTLIFIVLLLEIIIWRPLTYWARKFSYQMVPLAEEEQRSVVLSKIIDLSQKLHSNKLKEKIQSALSMIFDTFYSFFAFPRKKMEVTFKLIRFLVLLFSAYVVAFLLVKLVVFIHWLFYQPWPSEALQIPFAIIVSISRLLITYSICLIIVIGAAYLIYFNQKLGEAILAISKIMASIPGTAVQPLLLAMLLSTGLTRPIELTSIFVLFSTMIWYLLFPVAGQITNFPRELRESAESFSPSRFYILKNIIIPGSFPAFVTGSLAAWGGGWNALVVAEYIVFKEQVHSTFGIGALIDKAAYVSGDAVLLSLCLLALVATIIILNRLIWQPLYSIAAKKYTLEVE